MELALDGAKCLVDKLLNFLTDDLVAGYVASQELGLNFDIIKRELLTTQALLHAAQENGVSNDNGGLQGLLQELRRKGADAEDVLDELHYLRIKDKLDGTNKFDPWVPDDLRGQVVHGRAALRHTTVGNCFSCFSCSSTQDDSDGVDDLINNPNKTAKPDKSRDVDNLDRVAMSNNIKSVIGGIQSLCEPISRLLTINTNKNRVESMGVTLGEQRATSSLPNKPSLYGRDDIFKKILSDITSSVIYHQTLSVLPIFGIGGVGKTTFAQHLYNHEKIDKHFLVRVWVCVSNNFDVLKLTKEILHCIPAERNEDNNRANESNNLDQLHQSIVKRLKSKRFLIVLDDIWECSPRKWEDLLAPLKNGESEKGSMVLVTTRFRSIAQDVKTNNPIHLEGLDPSDIMKLIQEYIFDQTTTGSSYDHECMVEIARQIAAKLKGSPLAATTVARLLKKNFSREHWKRILERQEWLDENNVDGIMPALKISYNYLPSHLKKCFLYFGLFPEDFGFHSLIITQFWDAIGIISSNDKPEVTGQKYLDEFVDRGFLVKEEGESNSTYVMHDLLHELSQCVSYRECTTISSTNLRADNIPKSIEHLSITVGESHGNFEEEMDRLRRRVDIGRLRSLMIFGGTNASIDTILGNTFSEIKRLRVLSIILRSNESCTQNFSKLIHLRYLIILYPYQDTNPHVPLPTTISTLYHLKFLYICCENLPRNFSRLVSLRHFLAVGETLSEVPGVGEMKYLQELEVFKVKKEAVGFELDQLGKLRELGGKLCIRGLEKVETREDASQADLRQKENLYKLALEWEPENTMDPDIADNVIDGFEPHPDLRKLTIDHHPGAVGPTWLCRDICTTSLESLHLHGISWNVLPPFGLLPLLKKLKLSNIAVISQFGPDYGDVTKNSFKSLKTIVLQGMPDLVKWVEGAVNYHLFSSLERIKCSNCHQLSELPFSECTNPFPNLSSLTILDCPKLSLPPLPHTSTLTDILILLHINNDVPKWKYNLLPSFTSDFPGLKYKKCSLDILKYSGANLVFDNLVKVENFKIKDAPHISLTDLRKLYSLRDLSIYDRNADSSFFGDLSGNLVLPSVQKLEVQTHFYPITELLPFALMCFPNLLELDMNFNEFKRWEEWEKEEVLPGFPSHSSLRKITISGCRNLVVPLEEGGLLGCLASLESLSLSYSDKLFSRWSTGDVRDRSINPFPDSLIELKISSVASLRSMDLIQSLTSLTHLQLQDCRNLTIDGLNPHITLNLKKLVVSCRGENGSVAADLFTEVGRSNPSTMGFFGQLEHLCVDNMASVLVGPICKLLSAKLGTLEFCVDHEMESFTEEQDNALQQLASLEELSFHRCWSLKFLPEGLHGLQSLKRLYVSQCYRIRSFPHNGFPPSLESLAISTSNSKELQEEVRKLDRGIYPNLVISDY